MPRAPPLLLLTEVGSEEESDKGAEGGRIVEPKSEEATGGEVEELGLGETTQ